MPQFSYRFGSPIGRPGRLFICEFITGGGLSGMPIPAGLAAQGDRMLQALIEDLAEIEGLVLTTTRDPRLPAIESWPHVSQLLATEPGWELWQRCIDEADAVWFIAPETGGVLERLGRLVLSRGRIWIGCLPEAIEVVSSKLRTARYLAQHAVPVVETLEPGAEIPQSTDGWVVKPDDGAGCEDTYYFEIPGGLRAWLATAPHEHFVVQPYVRGTAASLSLLCRAGRARIFACNRQMIEHRGSTLHCTGIAINALHAYRGALEPLAARVAQVLPGLAGYVGVDLVLTRNGPVVIEINPRLTTSYVGLRPVLGCNPARLVLDLFHGGELPAVLRPGEGEFIVRLG